MPDIHKSNNEIDHSGKTIARNTIFNLTGRIFPLVIAVIAIPFIISGLGVERFGVLMLAWMVVGYFGIFDMGIGRATTKYIAEAVEYSDYKKQTEIVWASLISLIGLGVIASVIAVILMPWLVNSVLNIPPNLRRESLTAFIILSMSLPFVLGTTGARAVLEGQHKFKIVNVIKIPASMYSFIAPLMVLLFTQSLIYVVTALVIGRVIVFFIHAYVCISSLQSSKNPALPKTEVLKQLFGFGIWMTITIGVGSFMSFGYIDRFLISSLLDMQAVTYHATPFEMSIKMLIVAGGVLGVLFPVFSAYAGEQKERMMILHQRAVKILLFCLGPVTLLIITFAKPILLYWLGDEFAIKSTLVLQIIIYGVLINSLSLASSSVIQAVNRPDLTAKRTLVLLPFYLLAAYLCTSRWGIVGTACVWSGWVIVDILLLYVILWRILPEQSKNITHGFITVLIAITGIPVISYVFSMINSIPLRIIIACLSTVLILFCFWKYIFNAEDRNRIRYIFMQDRKYHDMKPQKVS